MNLLEFDIVQINSYNKIDTNPGTSLIKLFQHKIS